MSLYKIAKNKINKFHKEQKRKDGSKFTTHLYDVAKILKKNNITNENIIIAAILHDIIEDTIYSKIELLNDFGEEIYTMVMECTDNKSLPKYERKLFQIAKVNYLKDDSRLIKIADKISNLKSILITPPTNWNELRIFGYIAWTNMFIKNIKIRNDNELKLIKQYKRLYNKTIKYYNYDKKLEQTIYDNYIVYLKENYK